jgi:LysR family transcriptional regulator, carnitine catabolism transcriptional activator
MAREHHFTGMKISGDDAALLKLAEASGRCGHGATEDGSGKIDRERPRHHRSHAASPGKAGLRRVPFFRFSLMVIRADKDAVHDRVSTRWSALNGETLISLTSNYPHQQLVDKRLAKAGIACRRGQTVNLLDTQIGLVEAEQGIAIIPSFGLPACRSRKVTMSELVEPLVTLEFYEISSRARTPPAEASEFSSFLKRHIARWAGEAGAL